MSVRALHFLLALVATTAQAAPPVLPRVSVSAAAPAAGFRTSGMQSSLALDRSIGANAKLDNPLFQLWQGYAGAVAKSAAASGDLDPTLRLRAAPPRAMPAVLVDVVASGDPQALARSLEGLGFERGAIFANDIGGWLPVDQIGAASALAQVHAIRASRFRTRAGSVISQGDFAQRSDLVRASTAYPNLSGAGVTVGVLSDSFDCFAKYQQSGSGVPVSGGTGYASNGFAADAATDVSTGDLPANVSVLKEADCLNYGAPTNPPFGDEGRAMLQIVHDVAPGASLAFYTAANSEADFANGILALANAGAKIIVDDVGYPDEPMFQDGIVAEAIDQVAAQGVTYFSAAGNDGRNAYENTAPSFPVTVASGAPNAGEKLLNFDTTGATTATTLPLTIPELQPGEFINLIVEWDQPYVTGAPGSGGASSALDLCMTDSSNNTQCTGPNGVGQDPVVIGTIYNPANAAGNTAQANIGIAIGLASGVAPGRVKFLLADNGAGATINQFQTNSPTLQGHPGAAGAAAVGAAFYLRTPLCGTTPAALESFSSAGGDPILFDSSGARLATPQTRQKPQFVAPNGGNDTFLGETFASSNNPSGLLNTSIASCQTNPKYPNFFGTSAAAPHAAGIAALLLQAGPTATPAQVIAALQNSALPMSGASPDYDNGAGFVQADAALNELGKSVPLSPGAAAPASSGGGGGGGVLGGGSMLILALLGAMRRTRHWNYR
ncbi:MAG: S8 family peptidase [Stenotrophobium sp.]